MELQNSTQASDAFGSASPEILSDEEMRSRAAAYAQQIYEQQLEAYKAQRARACAQAEYLRQLRAYEEACRNYYAQQPQAAVRIDPDTGAQTYVNSNPFSEAETSAGAAASFPPQEIDSGVPAEIPNEENFAAAQEEFVPAAEENESAPTAQEEAGGEEIVADAPDEFVPAQPENAIPEDAAASEEEAAPDAPAEPEPALPKTSAKPKKQRRRRSGRSGFPLISALLVVVCVAALAAEGYVLFSDDPRFEVQRNNFFGAIGWDNARSDLEKETPSAVPEPDDSVVPAEESADESESVPADENADEEEAGVPAEESFDAEAVSADADEENESD